MTISDPLLNPSSVFVWVWLPEATEPVVAGRLDADGGHAVSYHLDPDEARDIFEHQIGVIRRDWNEVCDLARLTTAERDQLWGRQFLNPFALDE